MEELTPGIRHWSARHPNIGSEVSSYWLPGLRVLLDPLDVPGEVDEIDEIILSNRHHKRSAFEARERFDAVLRVPRTGLQDYSASDPVEPYDYGEPLAGGALTPYLVTELWPDDGVLHIPSLEALEIADTVLHYRDELQLVPDNLMGDDPEADRREILSGLTRLSEQLDFKHLLFAHGTPIANDGRKRLRDFVAASTPGS
jgi:hypothetical protein